MKQRHDLLRWNQLNGCKNFSSLQNLDSNKNLMKFRNKKQDQKCKPSKPASVAVAMQEWHHTLYNPITRRFPWRLMVMWPELSCSSQRGKSVSNNQINNPLETVSTATAGSETSCWSESDPGSDAWASELTFRGERRTRTRIRTARVRLSSVLIRPAEFTWPPDRRGWGLIQLGWERSQSRAPPAAQRGAWTCRWLRPGPAGFLSTRIRNQFLQCREKVFTPLGLLHVLSRSNLFYWVLCDINTK